MLSLPVKLFCNCNSEDSVDLNQGGAFKSNYGVSAEGLLATNGLPHTGYWPRSEGRAGSILRRKDAQNTYSFQAGSTSRISRGDGARHR
jgi:hypothetical protein